MSKRRPVNELKAYIARLRVESQKRGIDLVEKYAKACGTKASYLPHIATGHRLASARLAVAMDQESKSAVPRHALRPDFWGRAP